MTLQTIYGDPTLCPFCGGDNIVFVNTWELHADSQPQGAADQTSSEQVEEYQCKCCDNRSFWV